MQQEPAQLNEAAVAVWAAQINRRGSRLVRHYTATIGFSVARLTEEENALIWASINRQPRQRVVYGEVLAAILDTLDSRRLLTATTLAGIAEVRNDWNIMISTMVHAPQVRRFEKIRQEMAGYGWNTSLRPAFGWTPIVVPDGLTQDAAVTLLARYLDSQGTVRTQGQLLVAVNDTDATKLLRLQTALGTGTIFRQHRSHALQINARDLVESIGEQLLQHMTNTQRVQSIRRSLQLRRKAAEVGAAPITAVPRVPAYDAIGVPA